VRQHLDFGEDVRHVEKYDGVFVNTEDLSVDDTIVAFWSRDPTYAGYLLSNFEQAWAQGVDARERISELLNEGPLQA
jgi:hypothetical protein